MNLKLMGRFFAVLLLFTLAFSVVPGFVDAQKKLGEACTTNEECTSKICDIGTTANVGTKICIEKLPTPFTTLAGVLSFLDRMLNIVFAILLIFVVIMLVWGSLEFVTSGGDETKVSAARQKMLYAVLGLVLALVAAGIPPLVRSIIGA
ncbi:MAG: hypothetical protein Q8P71_02165 [bacterium]|nr:hypothetical protein [bacterium]